MVQVKRRKSSNPWSQLHPNSEATIKYSELQARTKSRKPIWTPRDVTLQSIEDYGDFQKRLNEYNLNKSTSVSDDDCIVLYHKKPSNSQKLIIPHDLPHLEDIPIINIKVIK